MSSATPLLLIVESGTDVRLIEGLVRSFDLEVLARDVPGGVAISWPPDVAIPVTVGPSSRLAFAAKLWRRLRSLATTPILVQGYGLAALVANLSGRLAGRRVIMLVCSPTESYYACRRHNGSPGRPFRRSEYLALQLFAKLNSRLGQEYVVLSHYLAATARRHGTQRPIHVIPVYGVDTTVFRPATESKEALRARLGLPQTSDFIFVGSRVAPEKDSRTLLAAFAELLAGGRDVCLVHLSGGYEEFLVGARALGLESRVLGQDAVHPRQQLPAYYQAADLFVQASCDEGLGFGVLEAFASGTPVVASAVGGLRETVIDGETGWTCPPRDAAALAARMAEALDAPEECRRRAANGRALVRERFESTAAFAALEALLRAGTKHDRRQKDRR